MNQYKQLLIIFSAMLLLSCSSDNSKSNKSEAPVTEKMSTENVDIAVTQSEQPEQPEQKVDSSTFGAWGVDLNAMKKSISPGEDFFEHVSGAWLENFDIPADKSRYAVFTLLADEAEKQVNAIIQELASKQSKKTGTIEQKIGDLYSAYMDTEKRNKLGIQPIQVELDKIARIKTKQDLIDAFGHSDLNGTAGFAGVGFSIDAKVPDQHIIVVGIGRYSLPDRDFYLEETFKDKQEAYKEYIKTMLQFIGYSEQRAEQAAQNIYAIEKESAKNSLSRNERRNAEKRYNIHTYQELKKKFTGIDWDRLFKMSGFEKPVETLNIPSPTTMQANIDIINKTPLDVWKDYLNFSVITRHASILTDDISEASFNFWGRTMRGQQSQRDLWKRGVAYVSRMFGEGIGKVYVERHFPESSKQEMMKLIGNLRLALKDRIQGLPWMSDATKVKALEKLEKVNSTKIGYPDQWEDYEGLDIIPGDLMASIRSSRKYLRKKALEDFAKPVDKTKWGMTPQTVNAYYHPLYNEIVFPAAILQPPFFNPKADPAVNYGAIGVVIGHEFSHGFDDQGRKYDGDGVLNNWWTEADSKAFEKKAQVLVERFNTYEPLPGSFIDGKFTLGENIGDLGGVMIAYEAYKKFLNGKEAPVIDGYTGDQRFFLSYAQIWRNLMRNEALKQYLKSDPHSPGKYRVNGILPHVDAWYDAFNIQPGDALFIPKEDRVRIW